MLYREIIVVCFEIHTKHIKTQSVPRSKHSVSVIQISQLMLYKEIIVVLRSAQNTHMRFVVHEVASGLYNTDLLLLSLEVDWHYSDTSANEDNSFRNNIR